MFTPLMNKKTDERGALMIEAIALLGLMTMMSPMVVRQTADRTVEMEDVAVAGQMKTLKDALSNWIEANYASISDACKEGGTIAVAGGASCANAADSHFAVPVSGLAPYLPATYLETTASNNTTTFRLRGNKLADGFDVGVRAQCTEARDAATSRNTCGSMGADGVYTGLDANCKCYRYKMTGVVLSNGSSEIDDRRAARIATMIGADGGFVRTSNMVNNVLGGLAAERTKIVGSQGIWEGDATNYIAGYDASSAGGRVAATTIYSSGFSGDYLYRKQVDGLPGANSMFTNLDMGGAIECNGTECNKINNAGGLEVVGGKILIRSQNTAPGADQEDGTAGEAGYARVSLGTDTSHIKTTQDLTLGAGRADITINDTSGTPTIFLNADGELYASGQGMFLDAGSVMNLTSGNMNLEADHEMSLSTASGNITLSSGSGVDMLSYGNMLLDSYKNIDIEATNIINIDAGKKLQTFAPRQYFNATHTIMLNVRGDASTGAGADARSARLIVSNSYTRLNVNNYESGERLTKRSYSTYTGTTVSNNAGYTNVFQNNTSFIVSGVEKSSSGTQYYGASFGLYNMTNQTAGEFQVEVARTVMYNRRLTYNNEGLTLFANTAGGFSNEGLGQRIIFRNALGSRAQIGVQTGGNGRGEAVYIASNRLIDRDVTMRNVYLDINNANPIRLYGDSGRVSGTFFQPEGLGVNNHHYNNSIVGRARIQIDEDTGLTTRGNTTTNGNYYNTAYVDINTGNLGGPYSPYQSHLANDRDKYKKFRVDPAFVSVMNDIKITSRGGARLSEALPNYILKGIYQLSNDYSYGGWPCGESSAAGESPAWRSSCSYSMPYMTFEQLGMVNGGWEFNCSGVTLAGGGSQEHPVKAGGGSCTCSTGEGGCSGAAGTEANGKYVTFTFGAKNATYKECPSGNVCWAHPFMGIVPAPGRSVSYAAVNAANSNVTERQSAQDEGVCPDGYQAVMTLTPNSFDIARVLYSRHDDGVPISYNPGWQDFSDSSNNYAVHGIRMLQPSQRMIVMQTPELISGTDQLAGWKIAMGFASYYNDDAGTFVWNVGGVNTGSWSALAHTYCYFNPQRFDMPNMRFMTLNNSGTSSYNDGSANEIILTPMDNPILNEDAYSRWMN